MTTPPQSPLVLIPARLPSSRYPNKALASLSGKPLLSHVADRARDAWPSARVCVVTDAPLIAQALDNHAEVLLDLTPAACGTDRIAAAAHLLKTNTEWIVNLQGDEPCVPPAALRAALAILQSNPNAHIGSACVPMTNAATFRDPNHVKVVCDDLGFARYFSRAPIPHQEPNPTGQINWLLHIGVYAFHTHTLNAFASLPPSSLELTERLEQLRAIQAGWSIAMASLPTFQDRPWPSVNCPEDLFLAATYLEKNNPPTLT